MLKKTISIRSLLLSVFLLLMIFPLIVAVITYKKENEVAQKQVSQYMLQTVEQTQRALDANLAEIDRLTWPLLYQQSLDFLDYPLTTPYQLFQANQKFREMVYFYLFRGRLDHIRDIYLITADHQMLSTNTALYSFQQVEQDHYRYIVDQVEDSPLKMSWFSDKWAIYRSQEGFQTPLHPSVMAVRRLNDSNTSELRGYLFVQLNDRFISDNVGGVRIGSTGSFMLSDASGEVIYEQDSQLFQNPALSQAIRKLPKQGQGIQVVDARWLLTYHTSPTSGWQMTAAVPLEELLVPNQRILQYLLIIAGLGTLIFIIVSVLLATAISKPVIHLARLMSTTSIDNLHMREPVGSIREISILQRNFNRLRDRIQQLLLDNELQQKEKRDALMQAMQMQIQPHFLYNTLDTIYWMSKEYEAASISKLVTALGRFFRFTLHSGQEWTSMKMELDHVENYLQIQSFRYKDKLEYDIQMDPSLKHVFVMPLILQPLVENALEHGIAKMSKGGRVSITVWREGDKVILSVFNSGSGIDTERARKLLQSTDSGEHVGMRNVDQRIKMAFGPQYGIRFAPSQEDGALVLVDIPYRTEGSR
ncbi:sensor histidine kinase [Paenibacillus hexagrammi]|uniref:Sensor histidine kinase n=1 Tax=Paenibacillus hexagrammi TaxID=2908839 RepID=A0ABY3SNQ1_9BACL|nr:sensor histidine kinase [Paenibacillus sp. YPD9-1]UJF34869.1 sensor histidine kinase [Paenibacillus sp. YPD9-1]